MPDAAEPRGPASPAALRHLRPAVPLDFPEEACVPETKRHLKLRTLLLRVLERAIGERASVGSDQFVYWNAADPRRCLAPDVFVRLGVPNHDFGSWKTWEKGAPELAVEIVSDSDAPEEALSDKLARYHELGVQELVRFDPDADAGARLRVWDRLEGDLVERLVEDDESPCVTLDLFWLVAPGEDQPAALRLARAEPAATEPPDLLLTEAEAEARAREIDARALDAAERRIAELEAELARRG